jgi:hypothetical protein
VLEYWVSHQPLPGSARIYEGSLEVVLRPLPVRCVDVFRAC